MPLWHVVQDVDRTHHFRIQKYAEKPIFIAENLYFSRVESIKGIFNYLLVEVTIFTYLILRFVVILSTVILLLVFGASIFEHVNEHKTISITQQWRLSLSLDLMWKTNNKSLAPIPHTQTARSQCMVSCRFTKHINDVWSVSRLFRTGAETRIEYTHHSLIEN